MEWSYNKKTGVRNTKDKYLGEQILFAINQAAIIVYLGLVGVNGGAIETAHIAHSLLLSLVFLGAAYVSYRNIKRNKILRQYTILLVLIGWDFLLNLFEGFVLPQTVATFLLPICFYQFLSFILTFIFQDSTYRGQRLFLGILRITCAAAVVCFFVSDRAFYTAYQVQFILSILSVLAISVIHRKRILFVLKTQWEKFLFALEIVLLPFAFYFLVFRDVESYLAGMGGYIVATLAFASIHNILLQYHPKQEQFFVLSKRNMLILAVSGLAGALWIVLLFQIPIIVMLIVVHLVILLVLLFNILLYLQLCKRPTNYDNPTDRLHFYAYSLEQIKREEALKKGFSDYLHDDILQDLLSIKNMLRKADRPEIQQLLSDTVGELSASIRSQMQTYHPHLIKSHTLKGNIQNLLDSLSENNSQAITLDCSDDIFLVEPYNVLIYRMIRELVTNSLKHSQAQKIRVLLTQDNGQILLKVSDDGIGFKLSEYDPFSHHGLSSIQEQVSLLNGTMHVQQAQRCGVEISITMPMNGDESYESFIDR